MKDKSEPIKNLIVLLFSDKKFKKSVMLFKIFWY